MEPRKRTGSFLGEKKKGVKCEGQSAGETGQPRASLSDVMVGVMGMSWAVVVGGLWQTALSQTLLSRLPVTACLKSRFLPQTKAFNTANDNY